MMSGEEILKIRHKMIRTSKAKAKTKIDKAATQSESVKTKLLLSQNALKVLEKRYLTRDNNGNVVETPEGLFRRVAKSIAKASGKYNEPVKEDEKAFYELISRLEFVPNSPTLMNAGKELGQLSACFVLPVGDSMENIFEAIKNTALIHKSGGGTGFSFSQIRPKNDIVKSTKGISSGPVSFMTVFDSATEAIKQGGTRRGANMAVLRVDHPDIIDFIQCKNDLSKLNNFNISVAITDEFMKALENDGDYDCYNPRTKKPVLKLSARKIFEMIVDSAWKSGEPGIIFIDRVNRDNFTPEVGQIESTNPCGEQPLLPYESCNLGSINLSKMVSEKNGKADIDFDKLAKTVRTSVKFLDNVIDANKYPLEDIDRVTKSNRKIGLGIMGFADLLFRLQIPYNSEKALKTGKKIMQFVQQKAKEASRELAKKRKPFPNWPSSTFAKEKETPIRNTTVTTIAPTGTISIIADCSSGIEPLFALAFTKNVMDNDKLYEVNKPFKEKLEELGLYSEELIKKIADGESIQKMDEIPQKVKEVFVTSHDITPEWHIKMQAAFQEYTDNAVSKTVNFPNSATRKDVAEVYKLAYHLGCKGVTVYRDGSRDAQVLSTGSTYKAEGSKEAPLPDETSLKTGRITPRPRPELTFGTTRKIRTGCGNLYVTINTDEKGKPFELFSQMGKAGGCAASQSEAISRLISFALRSGSDLTPIIKQLKGICCHSPSWHNGMRVLSCADAIAIAVEKFMVGQKSDSLDKKELRKTNYIMKGACPDCGSAIEHSDGCVVCRACGYTECM